MRVRRAAMVLLALASCGGEDLPDQAGGCERRSAAETRAVAIRRSAFAPKCVEVERGAQVFFSNEDRRRHNVSTAADAPTSLDGDLPKRGSTLPFVFPEPGTYELNCKLHGETAVVFVR